MESKLSVYNSLTRKKEVFEPFNPPFVGMYVCGPTVYNEVHLGNLRTFMSFDVIYRYLLHLGYKVRYVRNITDVGHLENDADAGEDKIAKRAKLEQLEPMEVVQKYTNLFHHVLDKFNCLPPSIEPAATAHIIEQIEITQKIIDKGFAYVSNGSVYFDVKKYNEVFPYGILSGRNIDELISGTRDLDGQDEKRNGLDFALWKKASESHIMQWNSPWGMGFPGWHLECSVMSAKYLGTQFDIHGGGMDLKFPHHECEIAQNCAAYDNPNPVKYWIHGNMLTLNGKKMSKSDGNFLLPRDLMEGTSPILPKKYAPPAIRFFMMQAHYGSTLDISQEALDAAEKGFKRVAEALKTIETLTPSVTSSYDVKAWINQCYAALNDDFNTPILIAHLFEGVSTINLVKDGKETLTSADIELMRTTFRTFFFDILGLTTPQEGNSEVVEGLMSLILDIRKNARDNKDWTTSDQIRDVLKELNIQVKDGKDGATWSI